MEKTVAALFKACSAPRADAEFMSHCAQEMAHFSPPERLAIINRLARFIAESYIAGELSFAQSDLAINNLAGYAIYTDQIPELMWKIYLAYDEAEIGSVNPQQLAAHLGRIIYAAG